MCQLEHDGVLGYGEACLPPYLPETTKSVFSFLESVATLFSKINSPFDIDSILLEVDAIAENNTAAKASVDIALHDLIGKLKGKACWDLLGLNKMDVPFTTYTLGIDEPAILKQKVNEGNDFAIFKVKLNGKRDITTIEAIRKVTGKPIVVDVNQGWSDKHYALEMIDWLKEQNVLFVEQPLPKYNIDDANWLFEKSALPIIADESVQRFSDINEVKHCFHGINIKLMKCTGMHEAKKMIQEAKRLNMKTLIGCMTETSCGVSTAAQLSPIVDYADLDGPLLIKDDLFRGLNYSKGRLTLSDSVGLGVSPL